MRSKKVIYNMVTSLLLQIVTIIIGFIIPKFIIESFGSEVNGLTTSITQFLGYIVLLEAGIGGVVRAALYKPLANGDLEKISSIINATRKFFRKIAFVFLGYIILLCIFFPYLSEHNFDKAYIIALIIIIGISSFAQYYFGIAYQILLQADQRLYVVSTIQILGVVLNAIVVIILIKIGASIHLVKFASTLVFIIRPITLYLYINKRYKIIKNSNPDFKAIEQRWNGFGHHFAFFVLTNTDIVLVSIFLGFEEVSVYSVYFMVVLGVEKLTNIFSSSIEATFGNMMAKGEKDNIEKKFRVSELVSSIITVVLFGSTALLILQFIKVYTNGITDANYIRPTFAYILTIAQGMYCLGLPYIAVVLGAGHYKETRNKAFIEALINISVSISLINFIGITGVAIGTLCAMTYRTIQYAYYLSKNIIKRNIIIFIKRTLVNIISVLLIILVVNVLPHSKIETFIEWCSYAFIVFSVSTIITLAINMVFYRDEFKSLFLILKHVKLKN